jgi:endonuclease/exonuclease/phosphatase family metal-dependent hydrolase
MKIRKVFAGLCFTSVVACLLCAGFILAAPCENASSIVRVMTQNMDAGTDFNFFAVVQTEADFEAALADTIEEIIQSKIPERAERLAAEIAVKKPDLIALQEVTTWEFAGESGSIVFKQLDLLMKALHARGLHYQVAVVQTLTEIDMSVAKYSDSNVILVRTDMPPGHRLNIMGTETHLYEAGMVFPAPNGAIPILDGWAAVDLKINSFRFKFVTTHLLGANDAVPESAGLQYDQAKQLVGDLLATSLPIILAGDFNSDAEPTHNYLNDATPSAGYIADSGYTDAWHAVHPHRHGYTWPLYWEDQMSGQPIDPIERIDLIFSRGPVPLTAALAGTREGANDVFASDHAGVVVDLHFQVKQHEAPKGNH